MNKSLHRRRFIIGSSTLSTVCVAGAGKWLEALPPIPSPNKLAASEQVVFSSDIEPWVRLIENTDRDKLLEKLAQEIRGGHLGYQQFLSALFLSGIRNVQPRPNVGFKFHAVLVINSARLASLASSDRERWLPLLWAADTFKASQQRDVVEGDWTMPAVADSRLPESHLAERSFRHAMDSWDEEAADGAIAAWSRTASESELFETMAHYGSRDLRDIGHKAIYVANAFRTLGAMSWEHAEPIMRSLAFALLCRSNEPNPSQSDLEPDRAIKMNQLRIAKTRKDWLYGKADPQATSKLIESFHNTTSEDAAGLVAEMLQSGVSPQSIWDALFVSSSELVMRQPGIVALHAVTTTNALAYTYRRVASPDLRLQLLLQNASYLGMFCQRVKSSKHRPDKVGDFMATSLTEDKAVTLDQVLQSIAKDNDQSARNLLGLLEREPNRARDFIDRARQMVFVKGTDSHDYKFSSAIMEDCFHLSLAMRPKYLAMCVFKLNGPSQPDTPLLPRLRACLES